MSKKILVSFSLISSIIACNSNEKNKETVNAESKPIVNNSSINCYVYADKNDTVSLKLTHVADTITGTLVYNLKEKDKNSGTIHGRMKNDLLILNYGFMSEGTRSVRQVVFKKSGNDLIEGFGETYIENNIVYYKNPDSLSYDIKRKLIEGDCE